MMWRHVDLVHSFLPLVSIATFWCVVHAQSDRDGPCNTCPIECIGRQCTRHWWTSMWGFFVTLVALTMDAWGAGKTLPDENTKFNVFKTFVRVVVFPWHILWIMLWNTVNGMAMLANLREALGDDVIAPLYPWRKSHIKIIVGSKVIVNLSPDVHEEIHNFQAFEEKVPMEDLSEALVVGPKVVDSEEFNVQLTPHGQLALLRSNVLPPYDEIKFLRGHSSLGMAIVSAQATGYIYGIIVRRIQGLQVSPIEAIACVLNLVILMKGVLHNFASLGHRPLLLYLQPEEEAKFIKECKNIQDFDFRVAGRFKLGVSIACGVLSAVTVYFLVNFCKSCERCVGSIFLFAVSLVCGGIYKLRMHSKYNWILLLLIYGMSQQLYLNALTTTFRYWNEEEFDVQSSNYLSQVLPYIG